MKKNDYDILNILSKVSVLCKDDGDSFIDTTRLDVISEILWDSQFRRINADGLFNLYAKKPLYQISDPLIIVSSHVDCERNIIKCFTESIGDGILKGTYDNALTNAAILYVMLSCDLPDNVLIAFTGDEEEESGGANDVIDFIKNRKRKVKNIYVLDVTEEGWDKELDFTIENNFWDDDFGEKIISLAEKTDYKWMFVPSNPTDVPYYVDKEYIVWKEADADESWDYDEADIPSFSFCIPTLGEMHSNEGIFAREKSLNNYVKFLAELLIKLS